MAYAKKTAKNEAYQKLKTDLKEGEPSGERLPLLRRRAIFGNTTWGRSGKR